MLAAFGVIAGCARGNSTATGPAGPSTAGPGKSGAESTSSAAENALSDVGEQTEPAVRPPSADEAVKDALDGLRRNSPRAVWDFLPPSYQSDVNKLVHEFADAADEQFWSRSFRLAERAAAVLKKKKPLIVSAREAQTGSQEIAAAAGKNLDALTALLEAAARSDLADPQRLKARDVGELLESTGTELMDLLQTVSLPGADGNASASFAAGLADVTVELMRSDETTAVVRLSQPRDQSPDSENKSSEIEFVRVEGKWIPRNLADGWKTGIDAARGQLQAFAASSAAGEEGEAARLITTLERDIELLEQADKPDECLAQLVTTFEHVRQVAAGDEAVAGSDEGPVVPRTGPTPKLSDIEASVLVIVDAPLDEIDLERTTAALMAIVDSGDLAIVEPPVVGENETQIRVFPVDDAALYARRIDFAEVLALDATARTISIRLKQVQPARQ